MKKLVSIIVGGTGQLGVCLSQELLKNNNKVIITTRSFSKKTIKIDPKVKILKLNIYNKIQIKNLIKKYKPDFIFYFAGQSSPGKSFFKFKETFKSNFLGCKNFLDIIKKYKINCKFINASSCEIYGKVKGKISLDTKKKPVSPYGKAKLKSFLLTKKYREKFNLMSYNAVIFNTESFFRNKDYLVPKICLAAINAKKNGIITEFGNLNISREWNWGPEQSSYLFKFVKKKPQDFILSNGKSFTAIKMINFAFDYFNLNYKKFIKINKKFMRKKDIAKNNSNYLHCLKRNGINRISKVYGKKLIIKMIRYYLNGKY